MNKLDGGDIVFALEAMHCRLQDVVGLLGPQSTLHFFIRIFATSQQLTALKEVLGQHLSRSGQSCEVSLLTMTSCHPQQVLVAFMVCRAWVVAKLH